MSELSPKQLEAVSGVAQGRSPTAIGKAIGVSSRTIQRWAKLPEFQQALQNMRSKTVEIVVNSTAQKLSYSMEALQEEHLRCYAQVREMAKKALAHHESNLAASEYEASRSLKFWIDILNTAISGEYRAGCMDLLPLSRAIDRVAKFGYLIYESEEKLEKGETV
jgi:hypothetical protein